MLCSSVLLAASLATAVNPAEAQQPPALDRHFLDTAEYFIAPEAIGGSSAYVAVGRMTIAPTNTSRGEAQFLVVGSGAGYTAGQTVWTRHFWRTRQAQTADIRLGRRVWCLNREEDGVYQGPRDRGEALNGGWWTATIADLADLFRQQVGADGHRLATGCLRVER